MYIHTRFWVALPCSLAAIAVIVVGTKAEEPIQGLLLNVGTELLGIVVTVAIVDWLLERRRTQDEAKKIAWRALDELDHAVWVWQGGKRQFDLSEMRQLLSLVESRDPLPQFTQNLFLRMGGKALHTIQVEGSVVGSNPDLQSGLQSLGQLCNMRSGLVGFTMASTDVARHAAVAAKHLGKVMGSQTESVMDPDLQYIRDPAVEKQRWRHFGDMPASNPAVEPSVHVRT